MLEHAANERVTESDFTQTKKNRYGQSRRQRGGEKRKTGPKRHRCYSGASGINQWLEVIGFESEELSLDSCGWRWPRLASTGAAVGSGTGLPPL